jgi:tetratricopeptide (TPR) repeat protein
MTQLLLNKPGVSAFARTTLLSANWYGKILSENSPKNSTPAPGSAPDLHQLLENASLLIESGNWHEAKSIYEQLYPYYPGNRLLCISMARAHCATGDFAQATEFVNHCFSEYPDTKQWAELYFYKGYALEQTGALEDALRAYEVCVYFDPLHYEALVNQGNIYLDLTKYEQAFARFEIASQVRSDEARIYNNAGIAKVHLSHLEDAVGLFDKGIAICRAWLDSNQSLSAENAPHFAQTTLLLQILTNKAWALHGGGKAHEALACFRQSLNLVQGLIRHSGISFDYESTLADIYKGVGLSELGLNEPLEALNSFSKGLLANPNHAELLNNRGNVYKYLERFEEAIADFNQALVVQNDYALAHSNLGNVYTELGDIKCALACYNTAVQLQPTLAQAHLNKALILLSRGEFSKGFEEYEWRWATPEYSTQALQTDKHLWEWDKPGEQRFDSDLDIISPNPVRLLVWNEQGVGDDIYFVRFLKFIQEQATQVNQLIVRVDKRLIPLLSRSFEGVVFVPETNGLEQFDYDQHVPMGSLAKYASILMESAQVSLDLSAGYLRCEDKRVNDLRDQLFAAINRRVDSAHMVIGLSWRSHHRLSGAKRSIPLEMLIQSMVSTLAPSFGGKQALLERLSFVSLQHAPNTSETQELFARSGVRVHEMAGLDLEDDLDSTAALIKACDVVISIDNSTAHLSASLGAKTLVLAPLSCDWRWQVSQDQVFGYPNAVVFRQRVRGRWGLEEGRGEDPSTQPLGPLANNDQPHEDSPHMHEGSPLLGVALAIGRML